MSEYNKDERRMVMLELEQTFTLALREHAAGRLQEAERLYRQILAQQPNHTGALHHLGLIAAAAGRYDLAAELIGRAANSNPSNAQVQSDIGKILSHLGRLDEAITAFEKAVALNPSGAADINNLGTVLREKGRIEQAVAAYERAIALDPKLPEAHCNLGSILHQTGKIGQAITACRQAISLRPNYPKAYCILGTALKSAGQLDQALAAFEKAIQLQPGYAEAHFCRANLLTDTGHLNEAIASFGQAITIQPKNIDAQINLGNVLRNCGRLGEAIAVFRRAIAINPNLPQVHHNLGIVLTDSGQLDAAITAYGRAIGVAPDVAETHSNLSNALMHKGQLDQAIAASQRAISLNPELAEAHFTLGDALKGAGLMEAAVTAYRKAVELAPDNARLHSGLVFALQYHPDYNAQLAAEEKQRWDQQHARPLRKLIRPHSNDPNPDRRLRIGYVSSDFRAHASANFLVPLFEHHDPHQVELFCYAEVSRADGVTQRMRHRAAGWLNTVGMSDAALADRILADRIDILVDLKTHTEGNRLLVFARKPAPVQVTWLGNPDGTGLSAIDYRLSDPYLDPAGMDESIYTETTFRLPNTFWCYDPLDCRDIAVSPLPAASSGFVTFGCLNNFCKVNENVLESWGKILKATDNSRLLLLAPPGSHRQRAIDHLQHLGIDPGRIEFVDPRPRREYLKLYNRIDIALDTFPCNGHTTSLDSFWMGVPVVTVGGQTAVGRAGGCQLSNLGLQELAGRTPEALVKIAIGLADNLPRLAELRSTLRRRMEQSPLMDAKRFARSMEQAFQQMWKRWCEKSEHQR